ncbi:MAG: 16S rRNA (uracil(1498)-N(3))-methyltransferase, partial [Oceanobacter sp.]
MSNPRIYTPACLAQALSENTAIELDEQASQHLLRVLRLPVGAPIRLFNGDGHEYSALISSATKKQATVTLESASKPDASIPLNIHLGQVISKGDRMDFTIQKATELGVSSITPLWSERCDVRLKGDRIEKKQQHWQRIAISACEQSGRNRIPEILPAKGLAQWLDNIEADKKLVLHPHNQQPLDSSSAVNSLALLVGPEGGFTEAEIQLAIQEGFEGLLLG